MPWRDSRADGAAQPEDAVSSRAMTPTAAVSAASRRDTLVALGLLTGMNLLNDLGRYVLSAVGERVRVDIPMDDRQRGVALMALGLRETPRGPTRCLARSPW